MKNFEYTADYTEKVAYSEKKKMPSESNLIIRKILTEKISENNRPFHYKKVRNFEKLIKTIEDFVRQKHGMIKYVINYDYMYMHIQATLPYLELSISKTISIINNVYENADFASIEPTENAKILLHIIINGLTE